MVVRCTKKMLDLLGGRTITLSELPPTDDDWYLNLVWIERQKCLLLTHAGTLFSVFRAGVRVADLRPLGDYLVDAIEAELRAERLVLLCLAPTGVELVERRDQRLGDVAPAVLAEVTHPRAAST